MLEVWALAADGQTKKAHKAYDALLFLTADFEYVSNAKNISALADFYAKDYKNARLIYEELVKKLVALKGNVHNTTDITERHRLIRAIEIAEYENTTEAKAVRAQMVPRPKVDFFVIGLTFPRTRLRDGIRKRLIARLDDGMLDEVQHLHDCGVSFERLERLGLEYRFCSEYLQGKFDSYETFVEKLYIAIGQFAKRQETWFRGMERKGCKINWLKTDEKTTKAEVFQKALELIQKNGIGQYC